MAAREETPDLRSDIWRAIQLAMAGDFSAAKALPHTSAVRMALQQEANELKALEMEDWAQVATDLITMHGTQHAIILAMRGDKHFARALPHTSAVQQALQQEADTAKAEGLDDRAQVITDLIAMRATQTGVHHIDDALAEADADLDHALVLAVREGSPAVVQKVLELGANARGRASAALAYAVAMPRLSDGVVDALLAAGASPTDALVSAARNGFGMAKEAPRLVALGGDPNAYGGTALACAAALDDGPAIEALVEAGADPGAGDNEALHAGLRAGMGEDTALSLTKAGADVSARGDAMLPLAARLGNDLIVHLLLDGGADPNAREGAALVEAAMQQNTDVVEVLLRAGADPSAGNSAALQEAAGATKGLVIPRGAAAEIVHMLMGAGADASAHDSSAAVLAARAGNANVLQELLIPVYRGLVPPPPPMALQMAAQHGYTAAVSVLLDATSPSPEQLQEALARAAEGMHRSTMGLLLAWGAEVTPELTGQLHREAKEVLASLLP